MLTVSGIKIFIGSKDQHTTDFQPKFAPARPICQQPSPTRYGPVCEDFGTDPAVPISATCDMAEVTYSDDVDGLGYPGLQFLLSSPNATTTVNEVYFAVQFTLPLQPEDIDVSSILALTAQGVPKATFVQGGAKVVRINPTTFYSIFLNFWLLWVYVLCRNVLGRCFTDKKV